jgi:hypothetical protein
VHSVFVVFNQFRDHVDAGITYATGFDNLFANRKVAAAQVDDTLYVMIADKFHYEGTVLLGDRTARSCSGTECRSVIAPGFRAVDILKCFGH